MIKWKSAVCKAVLVVGLGYSQNLSAEEFASAKVLEWSEGSQDSFFQTSVTMIGVVASQMEGKSHIARCIDGWYWDGDKASAEKNESIRDAMRRFPRYHPQAVILAVIEKACGEF